MCVRSLVATFIHYAFQYAFTTLIVILIIICDLLRLRKPVYALLKFWSRALFWTLGTSIEVEGKENLRRESAQLLVLNHSSAYDIPALYYLFPNSSFIGKRSLMKIPVFGQLLRAIGYIPIEPKNLRQSIRALHSGAERLSKGTSIVIFPEGTRTDDGRLGDFKRGFVRILRETGVPLQAITLCGLYDLKSKKDHVIHYQRKIRIIVHPQISSQEIEEMKDRELIEKTRKTIELPLLEKYKQQVEKG